MGSSRADADGIGLAGNTQVTDVHIVAARSEVAASLKAQSDVGIPGGIVLESFITVSRVVVAG